MNTLSNALPIVASAYGRKFGVLVHVGGTVAGTDGQVIHIPTINNDPGTKTLAWGYLAHEAGHIRHTNIGAWNGVLSQPLLKAITNILEDVRIENAMISSYPGTRKTLDAVFDWMIGAGEIAAPKPDEPAPIVFVNALLVLARYRYRHQSALAGIAQDSERVLRQVFPASFVQRLLGLMTDIRGLKSTEDTAALAQKMVALIEEEATQPQEPQEQNGTDSEDGSSQDAPAKSDDSSGEQDQPQAPDKPDQGNGHLYVTNARTNLKDLLAAEEEDLPPDMFKTLAEALGTQSQGQSTTLLPTIQDYTGNPQQGRQLLSQARGHSAKLTTRLQSLVQAHTMSKLRTVRRGRTLSPVHLHRVAVGDTRVFERWDARQAPNTAIHLLVDLSGSMACGNDAIALEAAMALALALEPIRGVTRAVTAFPGIGGAEDKVTCIISHGSRVASRAGAFVQCARGSTPMTGALWYAASDLITRREERKVILCLTDGDPDDICTARKMIGEASKAGIEMIGVGIQLDVGRLFPVAIRIGSVNDLKGELFRIAEQLLLN